MKRMIRLLAIITAAAAALALPAAPMLRAQTMQAMPAAPTTPAPPALLDVQWNPGAEDCAHDTQAAIQVHRYDPNTYILRQNLCLSAEGNFLFLLLGNDKALLIDSGAIADAGKMPVAKTVLELLPAHGAGKLPLLVVHTHGHTDHTDGDAQFAGIAGVEVVPPDLDSVKRYFNFTNWPDGLAHIDLGGRVVDVLPSPGHQRAHVVFYDRNTTLLITGDFLLQGRLLIQDAAVDKASAERVITFVQDKPVAYILGTHIEKNADGEIYSPGATFHPREHVLQLSKADLLALPAAIDHYNGFYSQHGQFVMMNQNRMLAVMAAVLLIAIALVIWGIWRFFKARRRKKLAAAAI
jgi:hydroxyacylglutathione hydrolase